MPYAAGLAEDEKIHRMHCNKKIVVKPIQFTVSQSKASRIRRLGPEIRSILIIIAIQGWQNQVTVREDKGEGSYIVVVDCNDKAYTYKVRISHNDKIPSSAY